MLLIIALITAVVLVVIVHAVGHGWLTDGNSPVNDRQFLVMALPALAFVGEIMVVVFTKIMS